MTLVLRYAARSDRGLVRQNNQDSVYAGPRLLALADGMGGHAAGEVASKVVVAAFAPLDDDDPGDDLLDLLREATHTGNNAINDLVDEDPELEGMGTTLTAILFAGNKIGLAHVGDSRAYLMREGSLSLITHDDTFVQSLIDEGRITEDEASNHPQRSLLLKALTGHDVDPSLTVRETRAGDRFLLCSDGLSGVVSHETLENALTIEDPQRCADRLIELALKGGGPDNVTCIVADVLDVGFGDHAPIVGGAAGDGFESPQPDSAAARASATTLPRDPKPEPDPVDPAGRRRKRRRRTISGLVVLVLLFASAGVAYWAVQRQYYVSAEDDGRVVIYRGVSGEVLGVPLHKVEETSCPSGAIDCEEIRLSDLNPAARGQVSSDIQANDGLDDARRIIERLRTEELLPPCSEEGEANGQPTTPPAAPPAEPIAQPPGTTTPPADPNQPPAVTDTAVPPAPAPSTPAVPGPETALPEETPTPGVDCRMVR